MPARPPRERPGAPLVSPRAALLQELARGDGFGGGLADRIREATGGAIDIAEGSLYPTLRDLEAAGLIASAGTESRGDRGGRPRQLYRITETGRRLAAEHRAAVLALFGEAAAEQRRERCGMMAPPEALAERWVERDGEEKL